MLAKTDKVENLDIKAEIKRLLEASNNLKLVIGLKENEKSKNMKNNISINNDINTYSVTDAEFDKLLKEVTDEALSKDTNNDDSGNDSDSSASYSSSGDDTQGI